MGFGGFGEHAIDFFDGLEADNSKAYWTDHKQTYDQDVRAPMEALLAELEPEFGPGKVFRPYRDVRFSRDKSPYKTHCGGVVEKGRGGGAFYVQISPAGLLVGGGSFAMASDQLARYRTAILDDRRGERFRRLLRGLEGKGWEVRGERLRTRPRGVAADHPRVELLRYRSVYVVREWEPDDVLHERGCLERVRTAWRELVDINAWVADNVGVSATRF